RERRAGHRRRPRGGTDPAPPRQLPAIPVPPHVRRRARRSGAPAFFAEYQGRVHAELRHLLREDGGEVERAMAYTTLAPSKQVRAVLALLCAELCRGQAERAVPAAAAIEMGHA